MGVQREGIVRLGADAANAKTVSAQTITVLFRRKRNKQRGEATWGNTSPDTELGGQVNEVEIVAKNGLGVDTANQLLWDAAASDSGELYAAMAFTDDPVDVTNPLYWATVKVDGAEIGGKAGADNTQRWVFDCGAILSVTVDPVV